MKTAVPKENSENQYMLLKNWLKQQIEMIFWFKCSWQEEPKKITSFWAHQNKIIIELDNASVIIDDLLNSILKEKQETAAFFNNLMYTAVIVTFIIGLLLAWLIVSRLTKPAKKLKLAAEGINENLERIQHVSRNSLESAEKITSAVERLNHLSRELQIIMCEFKFETEEEKERFLLN